MKYLGICSNVRKDDEGERRWHRMMEMKVQIPMQAFAMMVGPLEFTQKWGGPLHDANAQDPSAGAYISRWGGRCCVFYQNAGFEFIWLLHERQK